ncbi:MAG: DUF2298 domain-containing protein [Caldilineaceae bacterium]|nr:DUF2298 domain-containing protein [Caldilineaceae bacterium]MCY4118800.1 DUF2298 domain-containing protein [Caldilineaceae bacterium]
MREVFLPFLTWYLVTQLVGAAALPLTLRYFRNLPDSGYTFARILGILLVSLLLWLGTSYGLLRNNVGGVWLALFVTAFLCLWLALRKGTAPPSETHTTPNSPKFQVPRWTYVLTVELLFLFAFAAWTWVRARDPAISHTEQPMDLMFMSGIWSSPTYPPRDPWLAGYAISYYYFGYWMITALARLAGQPPEIAYNVGQACWFGLLFTGSFGLGFNLLRLRAVEADAAAAVLGTDEQSDEEADDAEKEDDDQVPDESSETEMAEQAEELEDLEAEQGAADLKTNTGDDSLAHGAPNPALPRWLPVAAGLLTATAVALTSNLHVLLEWLYAQGARLDGLLRLVDVYNFPERAQVSRLWYIDSGWTWWWRASRVIEDLDFDGNHIEIIDEFPIFSYILGDNHPHVLAMPFVILVIAIALNWFCAGTREDVRPQTPFRHFRSLIGSLPLGVVGLGLLIAATGALFFLNSWDFPPYLLLILIAALFTGAWQISGNLAPLRAALTRMGIMSVALIGGTLLLYLPYLLTAQSQAAGILPNLFHPTRLPQFLLMFGHFLVAVTGLLLVAWREQPPSVVVLVTFAIYVFGLPVVYLFIAGLLTVSGSAAAPPLPEGASGYGEIIIHRRLSQPFTFLLLGSLLSLTLAMLWQRLVGPQNSPRTTAFVLCLVAIGILLAYAPEFTYLRDHFGIRMNTIFKFYYQSWLLLAIASAFAIAWFATGRVSISFPGYLIPAFSLLLILSCLIYPVAGVYAKINGFGTRQPTLNGLAHIGADEKAAIDWIRRNTPEDAVVLEAKGASYQVNSSRISAATGRATLLGWDGHQSQWRGRTYGELAAGRAQSIEEIYQRPMHSILPALLDRWQIDYLIVGPEERAQYSLSPTVELQLATFLELVFEQGNYRIFRTQVAAQKGY